MKKYGYILSKKSLLTTFALLLNFLSYAGNESKSEMSSDSLLLIVLVVVIVMLMIVIGILGGAIKSIAANKELWARKSNKTLAVIGLLTLGISTPNNALAASGGSTAGFVMSDSTLYLLIGTIIFLFFIAIFLSRTLLDLINELSGEKEVSFITQLSSSLTESVPVENEEDVMTDHEYDGIRELDNVLPPWWVYLFYATIIFGVVYIAKYHIAGSGNIMEEEYQAELLLAEAQKASASENTEGGIDETNVSLLTATAELERGKNIYQINCASCHGSLGEGGVGPNLTDEFWLHGGGINNIFKTIKYGVPEKGMISWQAQIKPADMEKVTSYIMSLEGSNPPGGKAAQGEKYVEEAIEASTDTVPNLKTDTIALE